MKFINLVLPSMIVTLITACGGSSSNNSGVVQNPDAVIANPSLTLVMPEPNDVLVEDFPLAQYISYPDDEQVLDTISSIDIDWPSLYIHQSGKEYGYIDATSEQLFYYSTPYSEADILAAIDLERHGNELWYVTGDNILYRYDIESQQTESWQLGASDQFSELAIQDDNQGANQGIVWLYNQNEHQLVYFDAKTQQSSRFTLMGDVSIQGLFIAEDNLLLLADNNTEYAVMHYQLDGTLVEHTQSWRLAGFDNQSFNDLSLMPDGRVAVSTSGTDNNLYLLMDHAQMSGDGPIADDGELILTEQYPLDETIIQPSGMWSQPDGSWLLITDQAEMYGLARDFSITEKFDVEFDSIDCNQGCTEAIVGTSNGFYALADSGIVGLFEYFGDSYQLVQEFVIDISDQQGVSYSYSGMAYNALSDEFYLVGDTTADDGADQLIVLNGDFSVGEIIDISYAGQTQGDISEYDAQGVHYFNGDIYVLSERFTKVLQINLSGEITAVFELDDDDVNVPSDLAVRDGKLYIIGDHENHQPVPPVSVFELGDDDDNADNDD